MSPTTVGRSTGCGAVVWISVVEVTSVLAVSVDTAAAQAGAEEARDRPGSLALLIVSLMLLIWVVALGISIRRARNRGSGVPRRTRD